MKLLVAAILVLPAFLCGGCGRRYIDQAVARASPDGAIIAASDHNSGEFSFVAQYEEVRLYPRGGRIADGDVVLSYGEDDRPPTFRWITAQNLEVQLPCGWWSSLTNHYQLPRTNRIINITYDPPSPECPRGATATMTSSTSLPSK